MPPDCARCNHFLDMDSIRGGYAVCSKCRSGLDAAAMTARPDAKVSEDRLRELAAVYDSLSHRYMTDDCDDVHTICCELLAAREREAKLEEERRVLKEVVVEALDEWLYAAGYKGDYLMKKHGDAERVAELRVKIGRADSGEWREE